MVDNLTHRIVDSVADADLDSVRSGAPDPDPGRPKLPEMCNLLPCWGSRSTGSACFGSPGSGSINQRYGSGSGSLPFSHKCGKRTEIMPAK